MRRLLSLVLDYLRNAVLFLLASSGVAALAVIILPLIGYMSFGDRPGPGWYGLPKQITWDGILSLVEYAVALPVFGAIPALIYFVVPYAAVRLLQLTRLPRWVSQVIGGLFCGIVALLVIEMAGWYIALGALAAYAGILGGALYGAFVMACRRPARLFTSARADSARLAT
jgi:hypothetical protein